MGDEEPKPVRSLLEDALHYYIHRRILEKAEERGYPVLTIPGIGELLKDVEAGGFKKGKRMGYMKGQPDLIVLETRGTFSGLSLEFKKPGGGVVSRQQEAWKAYLETYGFMCVVGNKITEFRDAVDTFFSIPAPVPQVKEDYKEALEKENDRNLLDLGTASEEAIEKEANWERAIDRREKAGMELAIAKRAKRPSDTIEKLKEGLAEAEKEYDTLKAEREAEKAEKRQKDASLTKNARASNRIFCALSSKAPDHEGGWALHSSIDLNLRLRQHAANGSLVEQWNIEKGGEPWSEQDFWSEMTLEKTKEKLAEFIDQWHKQIAEANRVNANMLYKGDINVILCRVCGRLFDSEQLYNDHLEDDKVLWGKLYDSGKERPWENNRLLYEMPGDAQRSRIKITRRDYDAAIATISGGYTIEKMKAVGKPVDRAKRRVSTREVVGYKTTKDNMKAFLEDLRKRLPDVERIREMIQELEGQTGKKDGRGGKRESRTS